MLSIYTKSWVSSTKQGLIESLQTLTSCLKRKRPVKEIDKNMQGGTNMYNPADPV